MIEQINDILPPKHATAIREVAGEVEEVLDGFIHGQATICVFLAIFYAVGLYWVGLNGGIAVGVLAGLVSFIPYVGALFGGVLAGLLGLMQFWPDITSLLLIAMVFAVGQFIEGNFLTPRLIGGRVRLHPVWIMFALLAFFVAALRHQLNRICFEQWFRQRLHRCCRLHHRMRVFGVPTTVGD